MEPCEHEWIPVGDACGKCAAIRGVGNNVPMSKLEELYPEGRNHMDTISRRDFFVGQALAGMIAANDTELLSDGKRVFEEATYFADALIARLDGEKESNR